jgi:predicted O-linked N-acetylglucosamine transferase (SPINDLY family)
VKSAEQLLDSAKKHFGEEAHFFYEKGRLEILKGSDKKEVVLPLLDEAYNRGLENNVGYLYFYFDFLRGINFLTTALKVLQKWLSFEPKNAEVLLDISSVFINLGNPISAINVCKMALEINPSHSVVYNNMGNAFSSLGLYKDALDAYRKALVLDPKNEICASNVALFSNYIEDISREECFAYHQKYRKFFEGESVVQCSVFPATDKIKLGFISADFCNHSVSYFVRGFFKNHDKDKFEIHLFASVRALDNVSEEFKNYVHSWHDITSLNHLQIADLVKDEKISVFFDLSGHTEYNSLRVFGLRPAPLQITYCGYPNTTGLKSIDYRITDDVSEPTDAQNFHSEKLYKIDDCFLCFSPIFPLVSCDFRSFENREIVFGSFNNSTKYTDKTIRLWARVINSVPNAKLFLKYKSFNDPALRQLMLSRFANSGLDKEKIVFEGHLNRHTEHLSQYVNMDIALDCFPYNGTTTTCEALLTGVPVITILGDRHVSRVSASILTAVGHHEFIAKDEDEFIEIAKNLAADTKKLMEIKQNLREKMLNSILCDEIGFTKKFENAILNMMDEVKKEGEFYE